MGGSAAKGGGTRSQPRRRRFPAFLLALFALSVAAGAPAARLSLQHLDLRELPEAALYLTVVDREGKSLLGLTPRDFEVSLDGVPTELISLESALGEGESLAVALLFDRSGSMRLTLERAREAAFDFAGRLSREDRVAVLSFDDTVRLDLDFSADRVALRTALESLEPGRDTALWDALAEGVSRLERQQARRRAVVLLSDGMDTGSRSSREDAVAMAEDAGVPIYVISLAESRDLGALGEVALRSGGRLLEGAAAEELLDLYRSIAEELSNQYLARLRLPSGADQQWHLLDVELAAGDRSESSLHREFLAATGPGVSRETMVRLEKGVEARSLRTAALTGGLGGLMAGALLLLVARLVRPGARVVSPPGIGLLLSAAALGALLSLLLQVL